MDSPWKAEDEQTGFKAPAPAFHTFAPEQKEFGWTWGLYGIFFRCEIAHFSTPSQSIPTLYPPPYPPHLT